MTPEELRALLPHLTAKEKRELNALLAQTQPLPSFAEFVEATLPVKLDPWQVHLCDRLEKLRYQTGQKLLIHSCPQVGKSVIISRLASYLIGCSNSIRIGYASYNLDNACRFSKANLDIVRSNVFKQYFPSDNARLEGTTPQTAWSVKGRVEMGDAQSSFLSLGMDSGFVSKGVDTLLIDDPYGDAKDAFSPRYNELLNMWWDSNAKLRWTENVVVLFHRYSNEDFAQHLLDEGGWEYIRYPAIEDGDTEFPSAMGLPAGTWLSHRLDKPKIEEVKKKDPLTFAGLFQGIPRSASGGAFEPAFFEPDEDGNPVIIDELPSVTDPITGVRRSAIDYWVRAYDVSTSAKSSANHTVGALAGVMSDGTVVLADIQRWREEWPYTQDRIIQILEEDRELLGKYPVVGIEVKGIGLPMYQALEQDDIFLQAQLEQVLLEGDKKQRCGAWQSKLKNRKFLMLRGKWNAEFRGECLGFHGRPGGQDDQVDAVSNAMWLLSQRPGGPTHVKQPIIANTYGFWKALARQNSDSYDDGDYDDFE